jgi:hypothetical protein
MEMSLVDVLNYLESSDEEMQKEASEMEKIAAEEEAAGRITARGFMDELNKLAAEMKFKGDTVSPGALKPLAKHKPSVPPAIPLKKTLGSTGVSATKPTKITRPIGR